MLTKWDFRFLQLARLVASWSKDPSTQVGCVIADTSNRVISLGFNGFPRGTNDDPSIYANRERKYLRVIHAEPNALAFANRDVAGYTAYVTQPPCAQCAAQLIQHGIARVVCEVTDAFMARWADNVAEAVHMFEEAGVKVEMQDA